MLPMLPTVPRYRRWIGEGEGKRRGKEGIEGGQEKAG